VIDETSKIRVLVVEDDTVLALDIQMRLHLLGYEVPAILSTGEAAVAEVERDPPDFVMMDIMLRGKTEGTEAALEIHRRFHIPIIFLTAYTDEKTIMKAKLAEPYGYITKPFDDTSLRVTLDIAVHNASMERERRELTAKLAEAVDVIRRLSGLLPVCKSCMSVVDNRGLWQPLPEYLAQHPQAELSQRFCPVCAERNQLRQTADRAE
jgi:two-component system, response regulator PdtaR